MWHFKKSYTLIELIMVMAIISVLAGAGTWLLVFLVDNFISLPSKLNVYSALSDACELISEGDAHAGGLQFASVVATSAPNEVRFSDRDNNDIIIRATDGVVERSINSGVFESFPSYAPGLVAIEGRDRKLFVYYDKSDTITEDPDLVQRVDIRPQGTLGGLTTILETSVTLRK